ncbi:DNA-formamidopyrimidine glycosylase, partial [Desulfovibrio sp. OttesenSCG-928-G15]|nr:DNA-formamidopyrimidine glycosylase [Desulfovibrio sp. OttesenSCG-928-G15]
MTIFLRMPELPEVETIARTLAPRILGRRILKVTVLLPKMLQGEACVLEKIAGSVIRKVHRRAKLLLLSLD